MFPQFSFAPKNFSWSPLIVFIRSHQVFIHITYIFNRIIDGYCLRCLCRRTPFPPLKQSEYIFIHADIWQHYGILPILFPGKRKGPWVQLFLLTCTAVNHSDRQKKAGGCHSSSAPARCFCFARINVDLLMPVMRSISVYYCCIWSICITII